MKFKLAIIAWVFALSCVPNAASWAAEHQPVTLKVRTSVRNALNSEWGIPSNLLHRVSLSNSTFNDDPTQADIPALTIEYPLMDAFVSKDSTDPYKVLSRFRGVVFYVGSTAFSKAYEEYRIPYKAVVHKIVNKKGSVMSVVKPYDGHASVYQYYFLLDGKKLTNPDGSFSAGGEKRILDFVKHKYVGAPVKSPIESDED